MEMKAIPQAEKMVAAIEKWKVGIPKMKVRGPRVTSGFRAAKAHVEGQTSRVGRALSCRNRPFSGSRVALGGGD